MSCCSDCPWITCVCVLRSSGCSSNCAIYLGGGVGLIATTKSTFSPLHRIPMLSLRRFKSYMQSLSEKFCSDESTVIISAPHGGRLNPPDLMNRGTAGCYNSTLRECIYDLSCRNISTSFCPVQTNPDINTHVLAKELAHQLATRLGGKRNISCPISVCFHYTVYFLLVLNS